MKRYLALFGAAVLAVSASVGVVSAQTGMPVNADGSYVVANDDGAPIVSGRGRRHRLRRHQHRRRRRRSARRSDRGLLADGPGQSGSGWRRTGDAGRRRRSHRRRSHDPAGGAGQHHARPRPSRQHRRHGDREHPGRGRRAGGARRRSPPTPGGHGGFCTQYATWYDAQIAYENLGATAADPALVQEVDPNYDGIACEAYDGVTGVRRARIVVARPARWERGLCCVGCRTTRSRAACASSGTLAMRPPMRRARAGRRFDGSRRARLDDRLCAVHDRPGAGGAGRGRLSRLRDRRGQGLVRAHRSRHGRPTGDRPHRAASCATSV